MTWTQLMDMHSGGSSKEPFEHCFIEAPLVEAKNIFANRFGHDPDHVTCSCCGSDYSSTESPSLEQATAYERNCKFSNGRWIEEGGAESFKGPYIPLKEYLTRPDVIFIDEKDIRPEDRRPAYLID